MQISFLQQKHYPIDLEKDINMIRQAAAYATVATIGSVIGTVIGCVFGVTIISAITNQSPTIVINKVREAAEDGDNNTRST